MDWGANGNFVKLVAGDKIRGSQTVAHGLWYGTSATAGTSALLLTETETGTPIYPDIAEQAQFGKILILPHGPVKGITLTTCAVGYVMLYFKEIPGYNAKKIHDDTPEATA